MRVMARSTQGYILHRGCFILLFRPRLSAGPADVYPSNSFASLPASLL